MLTKMLRCLAVLFFIADLTGCTGDSGSGPPQVSEKPAVFGTYSGTVSDGGLGSAKLTLELVVYESTGKMSGSIVLSGVPDCFTVASFSDAAFAGNEGAQQITAQGADGSKATISFSFSGGYASITIEGGASQFENAQSAACFVVKSGHLRREVNREPFPRR